MFLVDFQDLEKQRNADKMKEEKRSLEMGKEDVDKVQKLQRKLKQEQQHWEKECVAKEKQQVGLGLFRHLLSLATKRPKANDNGQFVMCLQGEQENLLEQREQRCFLEAERLRCDREELEAQLQEYQQNLDRLREGQRSVEREKEKIETQQRLLQSWRHSRQSSLPVTLPLDGYKVSVEAGKRFLTTQHVEAVGPKTP